MKINVKVTKPGSDFYGTCARIIADTLKAKPYSVIGLSTGRTTGGIHRELARLVKEEEIDVASATFFGLDEVTGVSEDYFGSCVYMLKDECISDMGVKPENFLMLPTHSSNWEKSCREFTAELACRGGIELLVLGLGENGHIGFNQPGTEFSQRCFKTTMHDYLEERIRRETMTPGDVELGGVTIGIADVLESRNILLCANGDNKRDILKEALCGGISRDVPATALQNHKSLTVVCDDEAASPCIRRLL